MLVVTIIHSTKPIQTTTTTKNADKKSLLFCEVTASDTDHDDDDDVRNDQNAAKAYRNSIVWRRSQFVLLIIG